MKTTQEIEDEARRVYEAMAQIQHVTLAELDEDPSRPVLEPIAGSFEGRTVPHVVSAPHVERLLEWARVEGIGADTRVFGGARLPTPTRAQNWPPPSAGLSRPPEYDFHTCGWEFDLVARGERTGQSVVVADEGFVYVQQRPIGLGYDVR